VYCACRIVIGERFLQQGIFGKIPAGAQQGFTVRREAFFQHG
jgi:hypothetical protein